jgi:hypothetical protein
MRAPIHEGQFITAFRKSIVDQTVVMTFHSVLPPQWIPHMLALV